MSATQRRRRDVLLAPVGVAVVTLFAALLTRTTGLFVIHLLADAVLGGYLYLLVQHKRREQGPRARGNVAYLGGRYRPAARSAVDTDRLREQPSPRLVPLRQTASN
jgi:hypothetical protein